MSPKFNADEDSHIAPCCIISDWRELERWEDFKAMDLKLRSKERKAECYCKYFEGKIPNEHKCIIIKKPSRFILFFKSLKWRIICAFRT